MARPKATSIYNTMSVDDLLAERAKVMKQLNEIDEVLRKAAKALGVATSVNEVFARANAPVDNRDPTSITISAPPPTKIDDFRVSVPSIPLGQLDPNAEMPLFQPLGMPSSSADFTDASAEIKALTDDIRTQLEGLSNGNPI